jgi:single-strand DNA-binding protein
MSSLNRVMLIGSLGRDPEIRTLNSGERVANFSVATSERWKKDGEQKEKTEWHNVVVFNDGLATICEKYLKKGSKVYIEGAIQTRKWTDKDGNERYSTEIVIQRFGGNIVLLSGKDEEAKPYNKTAQQKSDFNLDDDDPIPF